MISRSASPLTSEALELKNFSIQLRLSDLLRLSVLRPSSRAAVMAPVTEGHAHSFTLEHPGIPGRLFSRVISTQR